MRTDKVIILGIILLSFAIGAYFYPQMPERMASHWNTQGQVDGYMPKLWALFLMPLISVGLTILFILIPKIDPLKQNIEKFRKYFDWFIVLIVFFLFYIYLLTIFWNLGFKFDFIQLLSPAFALPFYSIGVLMEKSRRNWFIGIRTPWTLNNEKIWNKTHKIGGKLFKITGGIALLGFLFPAYTVFLIVVLSILISFYLFAYSYFRYQKEKT